MSAAVSALDPAPLDEQLGQRRYFCDRQPGAGVGELPGVDQVVLEGEHPEEEVAVGIHLRHDGGAPESGTIVKTAR